MGYADVGEEEDWGKPIDKEGTHNDEQVTSKKRKDEGAPGSTAVLALQSHVMLRPCHNMHSM